MNTKGQHDALDAIRAQSQLCLSDLQTPYVDSVDSDSVEMRESAG